MQATAALFPTSNFQKKSRLARVILRVAVSDVQMLQGLRSGFLRGRRANLFCLGDSGSLKTDWPF